MKAPTRMQLRNACAEAHDFISTVFEAADQDVQVKYGETMRILFQFSRTGKLSRIKGE